MTFGKWPEKIHSDLNQQKRIKSAKSVMITPIKVDKEAQTGILAVRQKAISSQSRRMYLR